MQEDNLNNNYNDEEQEIDLLELAGKLWKRRKTILKWCGIGAIVGIVVAFSIPRQYTTTVKIAPEMKGSSKGGSSGLSALAAMAGVNLNTSSAIDAVYPTLYPDVVGSVPFATGLFDIPVTDKKGTYKMPLKQYFKEEMRSPWWSAIMKVPGAIIGALRPADDDELEGKAKGDGVDNFNLSREEFRMVEALSHCITTDVDTKTYVVTITVTLQDPMVSAIVADSVVSRLKTYITNYRTDKSRKDYEYYKKITEEAKSKYYAAQQKYANYVDQSHNMVRQSDKTYGERLQNEVQLAFSLYNQTAQQMQLAQAKVQETTPVFAVIEPATVPQMPSKPSKVMTLIGFIFLAFVASSAWILFGDKLKEMKASLKSDDKKDDNNAENK
jgi:uncharacterized protein involved in exopolysaccharide biosynthesis